MLDNQTRDYVYRVITEKGFHDTPFSHLQSLTWRQLNHLFIELDEFIHSEDGVEEELADVAIVLLDLMALHGHDVPKGRAPCKGVLQMFHTLAQVCDKYRKTGELDTKTLWLTLMGLAHLCAIDLESAVQAKMAKNAARPKLYGVAP